MPTSIPTAAHTVTVAAPEGPRIATPIAVLSETFQDGGTVPRANAFDGCGGKNISPQLSWRECPPETKSFAVTCFDPDAPTGSGYWHWLLCNLPASVTSLPAGAGSDGSPAGAVAAYNDYGFAGYGGPCPPSNDPPHCYVFTVYALDVPQLDGVDDETTGATFIFKMRGHLLATGSITGRFGMR